MKNKHRRFLLHLDKALANSLRRQVSILLILLLAMLALSYLFLSFSGSDWRGFCEAKDLSPWLLPIYLLIDANALNTLYIEGHVHGWMLFASSVTYIFGMFVFNGLIIGVITNAIDHRVQDYQNGLTHYLKSGHYVIMGYDDMVPSIITEVFRKDNHANILLLSAYDAKKLREILKKSVAKRQLDRIIVNYGQRTANEYYKDINLEAAKEIFIVGNRTTSYHDAVNVECVGSICEYLKNTESNNKPKRITCVFEDLDTYAAFKTSEIFEGVKDLGIEFVPYNFYNGWAKQVFLTRSYKEKSNPDEEIKYPSVYGKGITPEDEKFVHLVFVGMTNFSVAFAMEAAHLLHFPDIEKNGNRQTRVTRITFIDHFADKEMLLFKTRNHHFFDIQDILYQDMSDIESEYDNDLGVSKPAKDDKNFLDVEFEFIKGDVYAENIQKLLSEWALDKEHQYLSVFMARSEQRSNFIMGMNMPDEIYEQNIPVFIRQDRADNFVTNLRMADNKDYTYYHMVGDKPISEKRKGRYSNIYPFGMDDMAYCTNERAFHQAKLINYLYSTADYTTYKFKDVLVLDSIPEKTLWKEVNEEWKKLTVALKWSNLYCAYSFRCKLDSLKAMGGFTKDNIEKIAKVEHNRWNVEKLFMGFRVAKPDENKYEHDKYSDELKKNKKLFIHHDIRPFEKLDNVRELDYEIARYIPWILRMTEETKS